MRNLENKYPNKLKELRIQKQMTLREVTKLLALKGENRLCRWERGQSYPSLKHVLNLCRIYNVGVENIYEGTSQSSLSPEVAHKVLEHLNIPEAHLEDKA